MVWKLILDAIIKIIYAQLVLSNEVELYTDFCKYIFLKIRSFRRKLRSRCSRLPDKRLSQEEQSSFKESKVGSFFCCIRQIKPRNKKIPVHYNTHEVKIMRRQYTTEEKQNLIVMFQKGRRKSLSLMTR